MKKRTITFLLLLCVALVLLLTHNIKRNINDEDIVYMEKFFEETDLPFELKENIASSLSFEQQLVLINELQESMLTISPSKGPEGVPHGLKRGVKSLYEHGNGVCYDRSYAIEQMLKHLGFKVRHISLYVDKEGKNKLQEFASPNIGSHAISEVKTSKGWMLVDSNHEWYAIDDKFNPIGLKQLKNNKSLTWGVEMPKKIEQFYNPNNLFIYGLFSRHGGFFPPYNPVPDYRLQELLLNL